MFQRYTEKARRVIFFARYEASQFGSPYIETEHVLLGLLREDRGLTHRFLGGQEGIESIRKQIEDVTTVREKTSTSVDLPLSNENKRVLAYAAEEAERLSHKHIGCEHLLLGLLREEGSFAAQLMNDRGIRLSAVREQLGRGAEGAIEALAGESSFLSDFSMPLSRMAQEERLLPLIGREKELEQVMHILGRSGKNNPVLVGEAGVGKRTIVEGLAQRVVDGIAPSFLGAKFFVALDFSLIMAAAHHSERPREFLKTVAKELIAEGTDTIYFFDELHSVLEPGSTGAHALGIALKAALLSGKVRCIAAATAEEYTATIKRARWLERCFRAVEVHSATEDATLNILQSIKDRFEKFHSVQYTAEALKAAVIYSNRHVKDRNLPDKAIDLIDDAGAYVRLQLETHPLPEEVRESRKRIKFIKARMEESVGNHEFEKARFYSDEERKERERLRQLQEKHKIAAPAVSTVTVEHIEEVLARWTGMPVAEIRAAAGTEAGSLDKRVASAGKPPAAKNEPPAANKKTNKRKK